MLLLKNMKELFIILYTNIWKQRHIRGIIEYKTILGSLCCCGLIKIVDTALCNIVKHICIGHSAHTTGPANYIFHFESSPGIIYAAGLGCGVPNPVWSRPPLHTARLNFNEAPNRRYVTIIVVTVHLRSFADVRCVYFLFCVEALALFPQLLLWKGGSRLMM